jgi:HEAT repeat protein
MMENLQFIDYFCESLESSDSSEVRDVISLEQETQLSKPNTPQDTDLFLEFYSNFFGIDEHDKLLWKSKSFEDLTGR